LTKKLFSDERFIGLGEKTGPLDRRGNSYTHWNSDVPAYSTNQDPLYSSIPFYIGLHNKKQVYGIFLDNSYKSTINLGASTNEEYTSITVPQGELNYYFISGENVEDVIRNYTLLTGRAKLPPYWSLGYQQCRWSYYPEREVYRIANTFREKSIPCDAIYLDINYMDNYKVFTFSPKDFPTPTRMISTLRDSGFHVVCIIDPGLKVEKGYSAYEEGKKKGLFVKYPNGKDYTGVVWPGNSNFPDFTNPKTRQWWGAKFSFYTNIGIDGFWNDMNEPSAWGQSIPDMLEFDFDGHRTTMKEAHNVYGMEMARATYEGARKLMNGRRPLNITRATYAGGQRYSTIWTGDNFATDEHMLLGCRLVNSLGISGFPFAGPDIGGFAGIPSRELITRWLSIGVFTPFMRNHSDQSNPSREPWVFGKEWEKIQRKFIEQRYQLLPYIYSAFYKATQTGLPVSRTLAIDYSFDDTIYNKEFENEFLFGNNLLVCPVSSQAKISNVYLPPGNWYKLSSDVFYKGGTTQMVESPLSDLPVFVKAGAFIPKQNVIQYTGQRTDGVLYLHFYKGEENSSFIYYEDDGDTYNFEKGDFYKRKFEYDVLKNTITLKAKEGSYSTRNKTLKLILHGFDKTETPKVVGKASNTKVVDNTVEVTTKLVDEPIQIQL
jgi:alpha-glucosidase